MALLDPNRLFPIEKKTKEIAKKLSISGAKIALSATNVDKLMSLQSDLGNNHLIYPCDLSDLNNINKLSEDVIDDFGTIVNPTIVEGQVHGGLAQGIGQALTENAEYDESGQLITASYMDYTMPRADNFPEFNLGFTCTHATSNPLGVKGCGEAGAIASPPTVMNAVIDALGGQEISMPATAEKVWKACKSMKKSNAKAA